MYSLRYFRNDAYNKLIQSELMLKRKSGNPAKSKVTKKVKKEKPRFQENKYEQKTISQTLFFLPKTPGIQNFSLYPQTYGMITSYIKDYKKKIRSKSLNVDDPEKTLIIQGPPGCGKTHFVRQLCQDFGLRILELNVSSYRNNLNIRKVLGEASQTFSIDQGENKGTLIFIDDIDIILEPDKGFYTGIEVIIGMTKCPVIMTCTKLPHILLNHKLLKIYKLECFRDRALEMILKLRNDEMMNFSDIEIENIYSKCSGNLHAIQNCLLMKVKVN